MEKTINFSYNWNNKLHCKAFTTIRLSNPKKYKIGDTYSIQLTEKGKDAIQLGKATIVGLRDFNILDLSQFVSFIDTGYSVEETKRIIFTMYKNYNINWDTQRLQLILLKYLKP